MTVTVTSQNFENEVMQSDIPVMIDFWASWCGPCRMVAPAVDELSDELDGVVKVVKINVDDEPELAAQFDVMSIPAFVLVKDGEVAASTIGARPKDEIRKALGI
jgi:thioredoxin 1